MEKESSELSTYFTNSSAEFFAESYQQMMINPEYINKCPYTCKYINNLIKNI